MAKRCGFELIPEGRFCTPIPAAAERYRMFELLSDYFNLMCVLHGQEDKQSYQAFCSRHSGANPLPDPTETLYKGALHTPVF